MPVFSARYTAWLVVPGIREIGRSVRVRGALTLIADGDPAHRDAAMRALESEYRSQPREPDRLVRHVEALRRAPDPSTVDAPGLREWCGELARAAPDAGARLVGGLDEAPEVIADCARLARSRGRDRRSAEYFHDVRKRLVGLDGMLSVPERSVESEYGDFMQRLAILGLGAAAGGAKIDTEQAHRNWSSGRPLTARLRVTGARDAVRPAIHWPSLVGWVHRSKIPSPEVASIKDAEPVVTQRLRAVAERAAELDAAPEVCNVAVREVLRNDFRVDADDAKRLVTAAGGGTAVLDMASAADPEARSDVFYEDVVRQVWLRNRTSATAPWGNAARGTGPRHVLPQSPLPFRPGTAPAQPGSSRAVGGESYGR